MALNNNVFFFWDVTPCSLVEKLRALVFKAEHIFHKQQFSRPPVPIEKTAWCHILHS
jgi:hypothetical protein